MKKKKLLQQWLTIYTENNKTFVKKAYIGLSMENVAEKAATESPPANPAEPEVPPWRTKKPRGATKVLTSEPTTTSVAAPLEDAEDTCKGTKQDPTLPGATACAPKSKPEPMPMMEAARAKSAPAPALSNRQKTLLEKGRKRKRSGKHKEWHEDKCYVADSDPRREEKKAWQRKNALKHAAKRQWKKKRCAMRWESGLWDAC